MMLTLVLVSVLSQQHGPKIIEVGQPVPVRTAKPRTQKTAPAPTPEACAKAEAVDAKPLPTASPAATNGAIPAPGNATNSASPASDDAKQAAAAKDYELQKQRMIKHAEDSDERWRKSVDALAGQR
jgi:hypothetical protein